MEKVVHNIFRILSFVLIALGVIFIVWIWATGDTALKNDPDLQARIMNPFAVVTYFAFGITAILAIGFPVYFIIQNPKQAVRSLIVLGLILVIGAISYAFASGSLDGPVLQKAFREGNLTEAGSRRVSAALIGTYILGGFALVTVLYSAIASIFRK